MNREIKFRAKPNNSNEWIYGDLTSHRTVSPKNGKFIYHKDERTGWGCFRVQLNTIGQYIGLKDRDGKEIYENDIVRILAYNFDDEELFVVKYNINTARYELVNDDLIVSFDNVYNYEVKIVGNIYDNNED